MYSYPHAAYFSSLNSVQRSCAWRGVYDVDPLKHVASCVAPVPETIIWLCKWHCLKKDPLKPNLARISHSCHTDGLSVVYVCTKTHQRGSEFDSDIDGNEVGYAEVTIEACGCLGVPAKAAIVILVIDSITRADNYL